MINNIKLFLKSIGPSFILAAIVLGPGSITVASRIGSEGGNSLLWVVLISSISMLCYTAMSVRFGVMHRQSILQVISEKYGRWFAFSIGFAAFIASTSWQFGNNLGVGIAMESITGINESVWPLIFTPVGIILIFFTKNLYKALEKIMMIMVIVMIIAFLINLIFIQPDMVSVSKGFLSLSLSINNIDEIAALVGTTFSLPTAIYQAYLVQDKGWKINDMKKSVISTNVGVLILALITIIIIITSATVLYPKGIVVNSGADMALQLEVLLGKYAMYIFSVGLCAAAFSSLMVNAVIGGGLFADSLGLGRSMNEKTPKLMTIVILILGMLIAVWFKGKIIYALIMAQAASVIGVPLIAIGLFVISNNSEVMGKNKNKNYQNVIAALGFILISIMVYYMLSKLLIIISNI